MLTRIRIEAEGSTTAEAQEDIFAAYDLLVAAVYGLPGAPAPLPCHLSGEVYEQIGEEGFPTIPRRYKGRALAYFPIDDDHSVGADQIRGFIDRSRPNVMWTTPQTPPTSV